MAEALKKVRIGNDIQVAIKLTSGTSGVSWVADDILKVVAFCDTQKRVVAELEHSISSTDSTILYAYFKAEDQHYFGKYRVFIVFTSNDATATYDAPVFEIVKLTSDADTNTGLVAVQVDSDLQVLPYSIVVSSCIQAAYSATQAASLANTAASHANEISVELAEISATAEANEANRVTAETSRASAETARQSAFTAAQTSRQSAFNTAEASRQSAFTAAQASRQSTFESSEAGRTSQFDTNETARNNAEAVRVENENARILAEGTRANAETGRVQDEATRVANEQERIVAEEGRTTAYQTAEASRNTSYQTAEASRNSAYQTAEGTRNATFASKESERDAAVATIAQEASKLTELESKVDSNVLAVEFDETDGSLVMITGEDSAFSASDSYINEETGEVVMVYNF